MKESISFSKIEKEGIVSALDLDEMKNIQGGAPWYENIGKALHDFFCPTHGDWKDPQPSSVTGAYRIRC